MTTILRSGADHTGATPIEVVLRPFDVPATPDLVWTGIDGKVRVITWSRCTTSLCQKRSRTGSRRPTPTIAEIAGRCRLSRTRGVPDVGDAVADRRFGLRDDLQLPRRHRRARRDGCSCRRAARRPHPPHPPPETTGDVGTFVQDLRDPAGPSDVIEPEGVSTAG